MSLCRWDFLDTAHWAQWKLVFKLHFSFSAHLIVSSHLQGESKAARECFGEDTLKLIRFIIKIFFSDHVTAQLNTENLILHRNRKANCENQGKKSWCTITEHNHKILSEWFALCVFVLLSEANMIAEAPF